jgi:hypothetical protein
MPASAKAVGPATRKGARGREILHLADHRRLDALAGAEQVDRLLREVPGIVNKVGAPGTARRAGHPGAMGLLELAGEVRRRDYIAGPRSKLSVSGVPSVSPTIQNRYFLWDWYCDFFPRSASSAFEDRFQSPKVLAR